MAKRYGRNQRRKHREEIARLEAVCTMHHDRMLDERHERLRAERDLVDYASHILSVLGPTSAFRREGVEKREVSIAHFEAILRGEPMLLDEWRPLSLLGPSLESEIVSTARSILQAFAVHALSDKDDLHQRVIFQITAPDGRAVLAMDRQTLENMRAGGSKQLAEHLLRQMVRPWMEGKI